jgi:hypothetical protein
MTNAENVARSKRRKKEFAVSQFGGECQLCGYNKCLGALDFYHIDRNSKEINPVHTIYNWSWDRAKIELEKCILLCANCHRELHYTEKDVEFLNIPNEEIEKICICGKSFKTRIGKSIFCSYKCCGISQRRVERPTKEQLQEMIVSMSWVAIGRHFGVSDNAVRKWAKNYGLK